MEVNFGTKDKPHWRYVHHVMKGCTLPVRKTK